MATTRIMIDKDGLDMYAEMHDIAPFMEMIGDKAYLQFQKDGISINTTLTQEDMKAIYLFLRDCVKSDWEI